MILHSLLSSLNRPLWNSRLNFFLRGFVPARRDTFVSAIGTVQKVRQQGRRQGEGRGVQVCTLRPLSNENAAGGFLGQSLKGPKTIFA
jgi:hypothetical protein